MDKDLLTQRTVMRPFEASDAETAFTWFGDREVMRFTSSGSDRSPSGTAQRLFDYIHHQHKYGFSRWIVLDRKYRHPIGDAGLLYLDGSDNVELGFRLIRAEWGRGLATEVASCWLRHGLTRLGLPRIVAIAQPDNARSIGVLQKIGMAFDRHYRLVGTDWVMYAASRWKPPEAAKF